jgi:hypothetical protein
MCRKTRLVPALAEDLRHVLVHEGLRLRAGNRVHVHRLQPVGDADESGLVRLDHDVAGAAVDGQLQQVVEDLGMGSNGVHGQNGVGADL